MNYWLLKSEPGKFSIDDLGASRAKTTCWDGVRNYQARNFMRKGMARGDLAFFYHSNCEEPGIAGIVEIVREAYPDDTAHDAGHEHYDPKSDAANPRWWMVDVRLVRKLKRLITLKELRNHADSALDNFLLLRRWQSAIRDSGHASTLEFHQQARMITSLYSRRKCRVRFAGMCC